MDIQVVQIPEGPAAQVNPVYYVTFLAQLSAESPDIDSESSFEITGAASATQVIDWALKHLPENLLLAEITAVSSKVDELGHTRRIRVWSRMPDTAWARKVGQDYTY